MKTYPAKKNGFLSPIRRAAFLTLAAWAILAASNPATAQIVLANPHWNITLTDAGYSDFLLDNTPGFVGREYLSGEWGAAVGYRKGVTTVSPQWLEPNFVFPDWATGSPYVTVSSIVQTGINAAGLPIAQSVLSNGDLEVTQRFEMLDTIVGTPMGTKPASAIGAGTRVNSNRYVLQHSYTVKNTSGSAVSDVQLFQLLHGLNSQSGVFDNRSYTGALSDYRYDTTQRGVDTSYGTSLEDYIGFHAKVAPTAHEIGYYGVDPIDDHVSGKPSDGVHLSIEDNWQTAPYSTRQGTDSFAPPQLWVAGAQRWDLGSLAPGASVTSDILLTILTGAVVPTGGSTGSGNGGSGNAGGVDFSFDNVSGSGSFFAEFSRADGDEMDFRISNGDFSLPTFPVPGSLTQLWELEFDGAYDGDIVLTFAYDPLLLPPGFDENNLQIYHFNNGVWEALPGTVNTLNNTIQVTTSSLSPFILAGVPEPGSWLLTLAGSGLLTFIRSRRRR
ncbi:MAG: PEP-CTERM sorting domain-containing protein [Verrucomicrobia bacterium]|nr:PEP-CTERM sorting domain-containing protein [Verrucomicrobiota bacterium]